MHQRSTRTRLLVAAAGLVVAVASLATPVTGARAEDRTPPADPSGSAALTALRQELEGADVATLAAKAAEIQAAFVSASTDYDQARADAATARAVAAQEREQVAGLATDVEDARIALRSSVLAAYSDRSGWRSSPAAASFLSSAGSAGDAVDAAMSVDLALSLLRARASRAEVVLQRARVIAQDIEQAEDAAAAAESRSRLMLRRIQQQARVLGEVAEQTSGAADEVARAQQAARDRAARRQWRAYVRSLARAGVQAPDAAQMQRPETLPRRFRPVAAEPPTTHAAPVPGIASTRSGRSTLTVLPAETIDLLTRAFGELGTPYAPGATGPDAYDCGGFTQAMWAAQGFDLGPDPAAQLAASVPVHRSDIQVGDLAFTGPARDQVENVGVYVGAGLMLAADGSASAVAVVPATSLVAAARVTLDESARSTRPPGRSSASEPADSETVSCGLTTPTATTSAGFVSPVAEGQFTFTGRWGDAGPHWATHHTGLDFAAAAGTTVVSVLGGTVVSVADSRWAGPFLTTIDHGGGLETTYAHMERTDVDPGDVVVPGQLIGAVGSYGNATGPHLHLEVHLAGHDVDPMPYLLGTSSATGAGWGGLANGLVPTHLLCPVAAAPGHLLRCDAARALDALSAAYEADLGASLCVTDSYRTYAAQVDLFSRKPSLAAVPGNSNHGWALAVDLCGGAESFGTAQHAWLAANAPRFGWVDPTWARAGGSKPEPWHWEFGQVSG